MTLPATVTIGPHQWRLVVDDDGLLLENGCYGSTSIRRLVIAIDGALEGSHRASVLLHELLHASLVDAGLDDDEEERMVGALAGPLLHALRANPKIVAALLE